MEVSHGSRHLNPRKNDSCSCPSAEQAITWEEQRAAQTGPSGRQLDLAPGEGKVSVSEFPEITSPREDIRKPRCIGSSGTCWLPATRSRVPREHTQVRSLGPPASAAFPLPPGKVARTSLPAQEATEGDQWGSGCCPTSRLGDGHCTEASPRRDGLWGPSAPTRGASHPGDAAQASLSLPPQCWGVRKDMQSQPRPRGREGCGQAGGLACTCPGSPSSPKGWHGDREDGVLHLSLPPCAASPPTPGLVPALHSGPEEEVPMPSPAQTPALGPDHGPYVSHPPPRVPAEPGLPPRPSALLASRWPPAGAAPVHPRAQPEA